MNRQETSATLKDILSQLEALGTEKVRVQNIRHGATTEQYGVRLGDIRKVAKKIKTNHQLGLELWASEIIDARLLAILLIKPKKLSPDEIDTMVRSVKFMWVADWLNAYIVKKHPANEILRQKWMLNNDPMAARAGWNLTSIRVAKSPDGLNISALLERIEAEMDTAAPATQWTMNFALAEIGINFPEHRERASRIGEKLGVYRDYPVSKGCTSPFAPIWINEMVKRKG